MASIEFQAPSVRSGHLLLGLLANDDLARLARETSKEFHSISVESLKKNFAEITAGSAESKDVSRNVFALGGAHADEAVSEVGEGGAAFGKTKALDQFTIDLTAKAREGGIDPVLGRDFEIRQVIDILTRRRQNNPILTGEAGVGKTAVVEGFALRIAAGDVPSRLRTSRSARSISGLLQAGRRYQGRIRKPPEVGDRRSQILAAADHSLYRRSAHDDRRRRAGRTERRREPAQAGAGARRTAHDRRDDLGRVQKVFREGRGARPTVPGGQGRRTDEEQAIVMMRGLHRQRSKSTTRFASWTKRSTTR